MQNIIRTFLENEQDYPRKLYLIENCIFGADIQPIAIQISKLRFFISLIVDQRVDRSKPNFNIQPLPNLEIKFVAANTLISPDKSSVQTTLFDSPHITYLKKNIKDIRHKSFNARTQATKKQIRYKDQELRLKLCEHLEKVGYRAHTARLFASWDPYDQSTSSEYFDPEMMFGLSSFDIVIGNPPYIQLQKLPASLKQKYRDQRYNVYKSTGDSMNRASNSSAIRASSAI